MSFLFINTQELTALQDLPLIQRVAYLMGIRPYMDKETCIVGIKRRISYQSLREVLYVAPIAGVKTEYPSQQQVRRVIKSLERAGIIELQSTDKHLILKCKLAAMDRSVQNKADMRPTPQADIRPTDYNPVKSRDPEVIHTEADMAKTPQADTPHSNKYIYVFLYKNFEKFWDIYPNPKNKNSALNEFIKINPDETLFPKILSALTEQINHYQQQKLAGVWMPNWKHPANWLAKRCWEDEIYTQIPQETLNATYKKPNAKQPTDFFWESCKGGIDYIPECETNNNTEPATNVINFCEFNKKSKAY
ncbi:MAG: hypothetical protein P1U74_01365 [Legionellaceae bacterium]|nr:hypothetical protein [Legionellaceae bacterium]